MKRTIQIACALLTILALSGWIYYRTLIPSPAAWKAANQLSSTEAISFGGIGAAAQISDAEKNFFTILESNKSHLIFRYVYDNGTPAAKAYAVIGLQQTILGRRDNRIDNFRESGVTYRCIGGCLFKDVNSSNFDIKLENDYFKRYTKDRTRLMQSMTENPTE